MTQPIHVLIVDDIRNNITTLEASLARPDLSVLKPNRDRSRSNCSSSTRSRSQFLMLACRAWMVSIWLN